LSSPHNTHGFEVDENEHDVEDKVYAELTPKLNPSPMVRFLRDRAGNEFRFNCMESKDWEIADYIEFLEKKVKLLEKVDLYLKTNYPDKTGYYFISGEGGTKDDNGLPARLHICPAYGADWTMIYTRTDKTSGQEY
jgi:hypothetical protein